MPGIKPGMTASKTGLAASPSHHGQNQLRCPQRGASCRVMAMLCDTCRFTERPGFVRARNPASGADDLIPCPECGGQGIAHCCDGICEQPELDARHGVVNNTGP
jgi:hypothetical protein